MVTFTKENIEWLDLLLSQSIDKTNDAIKKDKLEKLKKNIVSLNNFSLDNIVATEDVEYTVQVLGDLENISKSYSTNFDISSIEHYDRIKKEFNTKLEYLSTKKDEFLESASYAEDKVKKELKSVLTIDIKNTEGVSYNQAEKMVEADQRYVKAKTELYKLKKLSATVKTRYYFYLKTWDMCFQSVSTASKEQTRSKTN